MQALKTIVITLGVALVLGFGLLIYGLTQNWHRLTSTSAPRASAGWGDVALRQPPDTRVHSVVASGNHVVLLVGEAEGGRERLIVLDPATGAVVGTFWMAAP